MTGFSVPGYQVVARLAHPRPARWLACDLAADRTVVLTRVPTLVGGGTGGALAATAEHERLLGDLRHPHLWRPLTALPHPGGVILVHEHIAGTWLTELLGARGPLRRAEAIGVAVAVADALAAMHARGAAHGAVGVESVFIGAGAAVLVDLGGAGLAGERAGGARDDLHALGRLCHALLAPPARSSTSVGGVRRGEPLVPVDPEGVEVARLTGLPHALVEIVRALLSPDPPAADVAAAALRECGVDQVPVLTEVRRQAAVAPGPARRPAGPGHRRRAGGHGSGRGGGRGSGRGGGGQRMRSGWTGRISVAGAPLAAVAAIGVALSLVAAAVVLGVLSARAGAGSGRVATGQATLGAVSPAGPSASQPARSPAGDRREQTLWPAVLAALDARRGDAFARLDESLLADVYAAGSPALTRDLATLRQLRGSGLRARGLRLAVVDVEPMVVRASDATLRVTDTRPSYDLVDSSGSVVERAPARGAAHWQVSLVRASQTAPWRILDVTR